MDHEINQGTTRVFNGVNRVNRPSYGSMNYEFNEWTREMENGEFVDESADQEISQFIFFKKIQR